MNGTPPTFCCGYEKLFNHRTARHHHQPLTHTHALTLRTIAIGFPSSFNPRAWTKIPITLKQRRDATAEIRNRFIRLRHFPGGASRRVHTPHHHLRVVGESPLSLWYATPCSPHMIVCAHVQCIIRAYASHESEMMCVLTHLAHLTHSHKTHNITKALILRKDFRPFKSLNKPSKY